MVFTALYLCLVVGVPGGIGLLVGVLSAIVAAVPERVKSATYPIVEDYIGLAVVPIFAFGLIAVVIIAEAVQRIWALYRSLPDHVRRRQMEIIGRLAPGPVDVDTPIMCVRVYGDEAALWLRIMDDISHAPYALWNSATKFILAGISVFGAWMILASDEALSVLSPFGLAMLVPLAGSLFILGVVVMFPIYQITLMAVPKALRSHAFGFGGETILDNWLVRIRPVTLAKYPNVLECPYRGRGFRHSWLYQNQQVTADVAWWVITVMARAPERKRA